MKRRTIVTALIFSVSMGLIACSESGGKPTGNGVDIQELTENQPEVHGNAVKPEDVKLTTPLNAEWVAAGKSTYELKCQSCHKLTDEKLVGPGWAGVTKKREPHWILNMITNVDMMLETDPEAQKLLELCLVRMPNQNISVDEARQVLEYMRSNDGEK
jgi:mono/diheme cytochrome c family protein